jgi:hypothetical protein
MDQNVKRTFFQKDSPLPSYELENGEIKQPYVIAMRIIYMTTHEYEQFKIIVEEQQKKSNLKIVKP